MDHGEDGGQVAFPGTHEEEPVDRTEWQSATALQLSTGTRDMAGWGVDRIRAWLAWASLARVGTRPLQLLAVGLSVSSTNSAGKDRNLGATAHPSPGG